MDLTERVPISVSEQRSSLGEVFENIVQCGGYVVYNPDHLHQVFLHNHNTTKDHNKKVQLSCIK